MLRIIVLFDIVSKHEKLCSDLDNFKRIDERNLSSPKKTIVVPRAKVYFNPAPKLLSTQYAC